MFNRRSFLAVLGLSPILAATTAPGGASLNELSVSEVLPPIPLKLKQTPVKPGSLKIVAEGVAFQDDGKGLLRDPNPPDSIACPVVGKIDYIAGDVRLWRCTPQGSVATYQSWG